jgi:integrase/recombinase XerC
MVRTWLASLKEGGLEARSINRKLSALKSLYRFLRKQQLVATSPLSTVSGPKAGKKLPAFASEAEMQQLLHEIEFEDNWMGFTARLLIGLLYGTGMRRAEVLQLKEHHVDSAQLALRILGKGNKERIIPVGHTLLQQIEHYKAEKRKQLENPDTEYLLVGEQGKRLSSHAVYALVVAYLGKATTLAERSPHVLRHTFATHLANAGADINAIKELLGHSSLAATQIYTHNTIEKLKDIHRLAHPKA